MRQLDKKEKRALLALLIALLCFYLYPRQIIVNTGFDQLLMGIGALCLLYAMIVAIRPSSRPAPPADHERRAANSEEQMSVLDQTIETSNCTDEQERTAAEARSEQEE